MHELCEAEAFRLLEAYIGELVVVLGSDRHGTMPTQKRFQSGGREMGGGPDLDCKLLRMPSLTFSDVLTDSSG